MSHRHRPPDFRRFVDTPRLGSLYGNKMLPYTNPMNGRFPRVMSVLLRGCVARFAFVPFAAMPPVTVRAASRIAMPPLSVSDFVDTEASTNVPITVRRGDARGFALGIDFSPSPSNAFTVALGRDADDDGVLTPGETELTLGWRGGRCVVENAAGWVRLEELALAGTLALRVETDGAGRPRRFSADCGGAAVFTRLAASPPEWLFDTGWNLVRITRRGPSAAPSGWVRIAVDHRGLVLRVR